MEWVIVLVVIAVLWFINDFRLRKILKMLKGIEGKEVVIMATLDDLVAAVAAEKTEVDSLAVFIAGLEKQLADALAGVLNADQQAKVDAIFAGVKANTQEIADAMKPAA